MEEEEAIMQFRLDKDILKTVGIHHGYGEEIIALFLKADTHDGAKAISEYIREIGKHDCETAHTLEDYFMRLFAQMIKLAIIRDNQEGLIASVIVELQEADFARWCA